MSSKIAVYELVDVLTAYVVLLPFSLYHNQFYNQEIHKQKGLLHSVEYGNDLTKCFLDLPHYQKFQLCHSQHQSSFI